MVKKLLLSVFFIQSLLLATREPSAAYKRIKPLIAAIERDNTSGLSVFIDSNPECVFWCDDSGNTLLHYAAVFCFRNGLERGIGTVTVLLHAGANPNACNDCGQRPSDWIAVGVDGGIALQSCCSVTQKEPVRRYLAG